MKRIALSVVAATALAFAWSAAAYACGCDKTGAKEDKSGAKKAEKKQAGTMVVLAVKGIHCSGSGAQVAKKLRGIKGVESARIDVAKKQAQVTYRADQTTVKRLLAEARKLGIEASVVRRS